MRRGRRTVKIKQKKKKEEGERCFSIFCSNYETGFHTPITSDIEYK